MNSILNFLPFLVFLVLLWFTYVNISYGITLYQSIKEDHTLSSCLTNTGKYFYLILLFIYLCTIIACISLIVIDLINGKISKIYGPLNLLTIITLIVSVLFQQIIFVGHRQMMIGKLKLDYRKVKRVTFPKNNKLRFIYGQRTFETSIRLIDDFKLKKALQKTR